MTKKDAVLVIAEAGVNHNGSRDLALRLVDVAADAGADAIKFQTFSASRLVTQRAPKAKYQAATTGRSESQFEMLQKLELSREDHYSIAEHCRVRGIEFMSTAFDVVSLRFLIRELPIRRIKVPSGEITNGPLLLEAARSQLPIILSTGMSTLADIKSALSVMAFGASRETKRPSLLTFKAAYESASGRSFMRRRVTVLQCVTEYPAPISDANLRAMNVLKDAFPVAVGYSDHTVGITSAIAAVAMGARVLEKHFTLDRSLPGPDHLASLEPAELRLLVRSIRDASAALGKPLKMPASSERKNIAIARKSLVASKPIEKGERFTEQNLTAKRPGTGISPMKFWEKLGTKASRHYEVDELIK